MIEVLMGAAGRSSVSKDLQPMAIWVAEGNTSTIYGSSGVIVSPLHCTPRVANVAYHAAAVP